MLTAARLALIVLSVAACALIAACAKNGGEGSGLGGAPRVTDLVGRWVATSLNGQPISADADWGPPTLEFFNDGRIAGFGGVNRLAGSFEFRELAGGTLTFGQLISTKMAGPDEQMALEQNYSKALADTRTAAIRGSELVLSGEAGELLRFSRAE